jgi:multidrug efflux pump subunit AcrB
LIALDEVASLEIAPGAFFFFHSEGERAVTVTADVSQEKTTPMKVMEEGMKYFTPEKLNAEYPGVRFDVGGEAEESRRAMLDLYGTFVLAALGIYFLLMLLFNSVTQPLMVILSIPFGLCGVIIAFALHGEPFSFLGMMGVVGMAGVVVNDSLVLVDHLNGLIRRTTNKESTANVPFANKKELLQQIASGTADRLRPIILTTVTTVAGLLPLAYAFGGHDIYMAPMAMAIGYGLLFATPITLVLVPSLYMIGYDIKRFLDNHPYINAVLRLSFHRLIRQILNNRNTS